MGLGGTLIQIGITPEAAMTGLPLSFFPVHRKSVVGTLYGNIRTHEDIPILADMAMKGEFMLDRLINKKFKLEQINDVVEAMKRHQIIGRWVCEFR